ncbi:TonB-dependent receptor plug domain-containing protein [Myroides odoratimimus]|uniref:TonB-dependent receptor plug domain-containing protein n=1 Tax=Myroides odoratimimus TaxID=76832 RepID=UPI001CE148ED|nr:TonB-dependent receptor [Myroides odoratimimus]MCA4807016.1 TonB-dependent receptor [Myroides odoratimimus]
MNTKLFYHLKKYQVLFILLFFFNPYSYSQTRIIQIIDSSSLDPIPKASLTITSSDYSTTLISNQNGEFEIKETSDISFFIQTFQYQTHTGILEQNKTFKLIKLTPENQLIDDIIINTNATETKRTKNTPVLTQVISGAKITESGFTGIQDALMSEIPGMNFQKVGFGTDVNVAGLDARNILFLIDGEKLTGEMAGNLDYQRFNIHSVDRIEIIKGASSILYGSMASGAVINLITKKTDQKLALTAGIRYGQKNQRNYKNPQKSDFLYMYEKNVDKPNLQGWVSLGSKLAKVTLQTDIQYTSTDAYYLFQPGYDKKHFKSNPDIGLIHDTIITSHVQRPALGIEGDQFVNISQKIHFKPTENLYLQGYGTYFYMNTFDLIQDLMFNQTKDISGGLKAEYTFKDIGKLSFGIHTDNYNRFRRHERINQKKKLYNSKLFQPKLNFVSNYIQNHEFTIGLEQNIEELISDRFGRNGTLTKRESKETEAFIQDQYTGIKNTTIALGVRSSFNELFGTNFSPKLSIKHDLTRQLSLRINYSSGYRIPTIKEKFFDWDHLGMFQIVGNPDLKPEKNNYFSLSAEYQNSFFFININTYANYFKQKIEGIWRVFEFQYNFEYQNLSKSNIKGLDILGKTNLSNSFNINWSYSYVNVSKTNGVQLNTTSPHNANIELQYNYKRPNYLFKASLNTNIIGAKKFSVQDKLMINGKARDTYFLVDLPTYSMSNLVLNQTFYQNYKLTLGIDNLFNYKPSLLGAGVSMFNIPATPGRRVFVQFQYKF